MYKHKLLSMLLSTAIVCSAGVAQGAELIRFNVPVNLQNVPARVNGIAINGGKVLCHVKNLSTNATIGNGSNQWTFSRNYTGTRSVPVNVTGPFRSGQRLSYRCELALCAVIGQMYTCTRNGVTANLVSGRIPLKH